MDLEVASGFSRCQTAARDPPPCLAGHVMWRWEETWESAQVSDDFNRGGRAGVGGVLLCIHGYRLVRPHHHVLENVEKKKKKAAVVQSCGAGFWSAVATATPTCTQACM